jgi:hypothetical protein
MNGLAGSIIGKIKPPSGLSLRKLNSPLLFSRRGGPITI